MKFDNLLRYAVRILAAYAGEIPLHSFLKNFFRENPQMGSRDRKQVSEMCYCFFRMGHALKNISAEERILIRYISVQSSSGTNPGTAQAGLAYAG